MVYRDCYISFSEDGRWVYIECKRAGLAFKIPLNCVEFSIQEDTPYDAHLGYIDGIPRDFKLVYVKDRRTSDKYYTYEDEVYGEC